jgi:DNA-binding response OmpR family regulator
MIALTAWSDELTRARTRNGGFDHHLVKPASLDDILACWARQRERAPARHSVRRPGYLLSAQVAAAALISRSSNPAACWHPLRQARFQLSSSALSSRTCQIMRSLAFPFLKSVCKPG